MRRLDRLCHVVQVVYRKPRLRFDVLEWRLWSPDAAEPVLWNVGAVGVDGLVGAEVYGEHLWACSLDGLIGQHSCARHICTLVQTFFPAPLHNADQEGACL